MNFSSHCTARIREERMRLSLSQAQVAEKSGVSREMWGRYERGESIPGGEVLFSFAALGADIQFILTGVRLDHSGGATPREAALLSGFKNMPDEDKCAIERLVQTISSF